MLNGNYEKVKKLSETIPTFYVRFEDLRTEPEKVLGDVFRFLYEVESIKGTVLEKRILEKCCGENRPKPSYKLKSTSSSLSRHADLYNDELLAKMKQELKDQLYFFGYTNHPEIEHNTAFFEYKTHDEADLASFNEFRRVNEKSLVAVID